jgi:putative DNA primase/helicase
MRSLLYEFTADAVYFGPKGEVKPWSPNRYKISDLLEALSSLVILPDDFEQPCWIDGRQTGPIVATSNCLLDVASLQLYPHTPLYFGQVSVPFPYDPDAPAPRSGSTFSMSFGRMNRTPPMCSASGLATSSVGGSTCIKFLSWWGQRAGARV